MSKAREGERQRLNWREGRKSPGQEAGIPVYLGESKVSFPLLSCVFGVHLAEVTLTPLLGKGLHFCAHVHACAYPPAPTPTPPSPFSESSRMYHFQQGYEEWSRGIHHTWLWSPTSNFLSLFLPMPCLIFLTHDICHCENKQESISKKVNMIAELSSRITTWATSESVLLNITLSASVLLSWPGLSSVVPGARQLLSSGNMAHVNRPVLCLPNAHQILKNKNQNQKTGL